MEDVRSVQRQLRELIQDLKVQDECCRVVRKLAMDAVEGPFCIPEPA